MDNLRHGPVDPVTLPALLVGVLPIVTVNLCLLISIEAQTIPNCIPYLEGCTSVKTKRLFMHAAERSNHPWLQRLNLSKVDFGSGRRTIHAGGRLDRKYDLVVADPEQG